MGKQRNPYQRSLELKIIVREPTKADLFAAYQACVGDKRKLTFEQALALTPFALIIKNAARAAIIKRGGH